jgi:hypothetical protein
MPPPPFAVSRRIDPKRSPIFLTSGNIAETRLHVGMFAVIYTATPIGHPDMTLSPSPRLILRRLPSGAYELATIDGDTLIRGPILLCRELASRLTPLPVTVAIPSTLAA